ncbi:MAG: cytochrome C [Nitrospirae bacterium]|jgi:predicted CXXCH cytochrome family protein|nr:cytochrome C [Nitrospirota bacterium]
MAILKKVIIIVFFFFIIEYISIFSLFSKCYSKNIDITHFDRTKVPKGCASCHVGHGKPGTAMLPEAKNTFCFMCHGDDNSLEKAKNNGIVSKGFTSKNLRKEFEKPYRHPIEKTGIHTNDEILPEIDSSKPRHVECGDCHHHHFVSKENPFIGIKGTSAQKSKVGITNEYELCFNCHSYSANLPSYQTNKAELFNISNPSYHPVIGPGKNSFVPSLMIPFSSSSQIKCTNCHGNDDPLGPKGPHGSRYIHLLSKNFSSDDRQESIQQYELCYTCHRRESILNNESFTYHNQHISNVGLSCRNCHNPHGSKRFQHLIDFENSLNIRPSSSGKLLYIYFGHGAGQCYLNCHDKDHNPETYPKSLPNPSEQQTKKTKTKK